ncbi:PREDICTED: spermidine coumaroyl-CoA acyltransferase-like [Tarenaya hassleriana]|uniref:spermidine coumaroyl-CoA acyltransferase-like n=1 Tax=Tarenaya hassleriana TaxID=28532 RepID=UPI00053C2D77|nr:PREDICTED: spermidine coumaroyl-CoA acyltransferase-like [Tarenaya hassleriana]
MANQISVCPLMVGKRTTEFIKPSNQPHYETLSLSTLDNDPRNEIMYCTIYVYDAERNAARIHHHDDHPESLLKDALSNLLVHYYPLSGKLNRRKRDGKLQLRCNGAEGVPFTVATSNLDLSSLGYLENVGFDTASLLLPQIDDENYDREIGYYPLALQITKFPCGGFTIGTALTHAVCDGFGVARFISSLMELAAGKSEPTVVPTWERDLLVGIPDDRPVEIPGADKACRLAVSHYMPTKDMISEAVNVKPEDIKRLKEDLLRESDFSGQILTTFEVLGAYIWRSRIRALKLNPDGIVVLGLAVAIRRAVDPPLPDGYYGNACMDMHVELTAREVDETPISEIVKLVKEAKIKAHDKEYIAEQLRNTEKLTRMGEQFEGRRDGLFFLTDWRNIGWFGSMDFGWGEPVNLLPVVPPDRAADLGMLLGPCKLDQKMVGGVKVVMTLPRDAMPKFKEEMEALDKIGET